MAISFKRVTTDSQVAFRWLSPAFLLPFTCLSGGDKKFGVWSWGFGVGIVYSLKFLFLGWKGAVLQLE